MYEPFFHGVTLQAAVEQNGRAVSKRARTPFGKTKRRKLNTFRTIVESVSSEESISDWGTNPPATNLKLNGISIYWVPWSKLNENCETSARLSTKRER